MRSSIAASLVSVALVLVPAGSARAELFTLDFDNDGAGQEGGPDDRPVSFVGTVATVNAGTVSAAIRAVDLSQVDPQDIQAFVGVPDFANQDVFVFDVAVSSPSAPIDQVVVGIGTEVLDPVAVGYFADGLATPTAIAIQSGFGFFPGAARFDFGFGTLGAGNLEAGETSVRLFVAYVDTGLAVPLSGDQVASFSVSSGLDEDFQSDIGPGPAALAWLALGLLGIVGARRGGRRRAGRWAGAHLVRCGLVALLGLAVAPRAQAAPDNSVVSIVNEDDGLAAVCDAPCFSLQGQADVYFPGNPTAPAVCPAGEYTYVYTLTHLGGSGTRNGGQPGGLIPPLTRFEMEATSSTVTSAGFIPGPDVSPGSITLGPLDVATWDFSVIPIFPGQSPNPLFLCSPAAPGGPADLRTSSAGVFLQAPGAILGPELPALEPDIDVVPLAVDFGDTAVGATSMQLVTVTNTGDADLTLGTIDLAAGSDPAFAIDMAPAPGTVLAPTESADVEVSFTPVDDSLVAGTLEIPSDDPDEALVEVTLAGRGVPADEQIMAILEFFDTADLDSTRGNRDLAMRNLLESAGDFIDRGQIDQACKALADALLRVDGIEPPEPPPVPDFVEGPDAEALAAEIEALRENLGCDPPKGPRACGIGAELALLLPPILWWRRRRRRLQP